MANFLEIHKNSMERGFWTEMHPDSIYRAIESQYVTEVIREWFIVEIANSEKKVLVKWAKRYRPLTDEELKEKYDRVV